MSEPLSPVSDHAVLRYMERVLGCDTEGVRRVIGEECANAIAMGGTSVVKGAITYRLSGGRVITVHATGRRISRTDQIRAQARIEAGR